MSAADLAAIREALPGDADPRCRCRECVDRRKALAALDRIEADTLTPEEAHELSMLTKRRALRAKLERIAGEQT